MSLRSKLDDNFPRVFKTLSDFRQKQYLEDIRKSSVIKKRDILELCLALEEGGQLATALRVLAGLPVAGEVPRA